MAYFPLFNVMDLQGFTTLANFSPNSREEPVKGKLDVYAIWTDGEVWNTKNLGEINEGNFRTFHASDFTQHGTAQLSELILLKMVNGQLDDITLNLPQDNLISTVWPEWRATVGFRRNGAQTSYQGEVNPFPSKASLLTFHPFIQFEDTENFLVFLNVESSPAFRWCDLEIFNASTNSHIETVKVRNNCVNIVPLDQYNFSPTDLPIFTCKEMAGIPFGLGKSKNSPNLSFEHTHPPGSLTIFGNRLNSQKHTKLQWNTFLTASDV